MQRSSKKVKLKSRSLDALGDGSSLAQPVRVTRRPRQYQYKIWDMKQARLPGIDNAHVLLPIQATMA